MAAPPFPLSSRPEKSWAVGPPKVMKNAFPATTVAGSAALPFVISTGAVMGRWPAQGDEKGFSSNYCCWKRRPPLCHLDRSAAQWRDLRCQRSFPGNVFLTETSWAFGPPKAMKNSFCSATTLNGSAALPFVISTGAQRSGEICGVSGPSLEMFFDRSEAKWRDLQCALLFSQILPGKLPSEPLLDIFAYRTTICCYETYNTASRSRTEKRQRGTP